MFDRSISHALRIFATVAVVAAALTFGGAAQAEGLFYSSSGNAIKGYDPVAYFTDGKPVEGSSEFTHQWMGATWKFASAANRDAFVAMPEKYAPQYGAYCAWAVSQGYTAKTEPDAWKIVDGKLYLNYSKAIQQKWQAAGPAKMIAAGDQNWPKIKAGLDK